MTNWKQTSITYNIQLFDNKNVSALLKKSNKSKNK